VSNIHGPDVDGWIGEWIDTWGSGNANWTNVDTSAQRIVAVAGSRGSLNESFASFWVYQRPAADEAPGLKWSYDTGADTWCSCIKDSFYYVGGDRGSATVFKLTSAGILVWSFDTGVGSQVREICVDDNGYVCVISTDGTDSHNLWRFDSSGTKLWSAALPYGTPNGMTLSSDGYIYVVTDSIANANIYKYNWDGDLQDNQAFGTYLFAIDISTNDRVYVAGNRYGGTESVWEVNTANMTRAAALHSGDTGNNAIALSVAVDGKVYVAGEAVGDYRAWRFGGNLGVAEWAYCPDAAARHIQIPRERNAATGTAEWDLLTSGFASDVISAYTRGGEQLYNIHLSAPEARNLGVGADGGYAFVRDTNLYVCLVDGSADTAFNGTGQRALGGAGYDCCLDGDGNVYVVGDASLCKPGETNTYNVMKFSSDGTWLWGVQIGDPARYMRGCDTDGTYLYVTGQRLYNEPKKSVWKLNCSNGSIVASYDTGANTARCVLKGSYLYVSGTRNNNIGAIYKNAWRLNVGMTLSWAVDTGASYTADIGAGTSYVFMVGRVIGGNACWRVDLADGANMLGYATGHSDTGPRGIAVDSTDRVFLDVYPDSVHKIRAVSSGFAFLWEHQDNITGVALR